MFSVQELAGTTLFSKLTTKLILLDLLFETGRYEEVLELVEQGSATPGLPLNYPHDCITVMAAAVLKLVGGLDEHITRGVLH